MNSRKYISKAFCEQIQQYNSNFQGHLSHPCKYVLCPDRGKLAHLWCPLCLLLSIKFQICPTYYWLLKEKSQQ